MGNSWEHPANTYAAVRSAIDAGVDVVEIDVSTTADGVLAVIHGPTLQVTTTGRGRISRLSWPVIAAAAIRTADGAISDQPVPRLVDLLTEMGTQTRWNIDLKDDHAVTPVIDLIFDLGIAERVVLSGSRLRRVRRVLDHERSISVLIDLTRLDELLSLWPPSRLWWLRRRYRQALQDELVIGLNLHSRYVDAVLVAAIHNLGSEVWTFTVDDQARIDFLVALGVDSVTTNRPGEVAVRRV
jgi:glycerophosphoryl diester phosphodiesterase